MRVDRLDFHQVADAKIHRGREVPRDRQRDRSSGLPEFTDQGHVLLLCPLKGPRRYRLSVPYDVRICTLRPASALGASPIGEMHFGGNRHTAESRRENAISEPCPLMPGLT